MEIIANHVYHGEALKLLKWIPPGTVAAVITDPMYGTASSRRKLNTYDWGTDPIQGDPVGYWGLHQPIYAEILRVLRPQGVLAWGVGLKFCDYFDQWFGCHSLWILSRLRKKQTRASPQHWIVQTREQKGIPQPAKGIIRFESLPQGHPCPKPVEEMVWMVKALTRPGDLVLDPFCGSGSTLVAAQQLGRPWIGCDLSRNYCKLSLRNVRLAS